MAQFQLIFKVACGEAWVPLDQCLDDLDGVLDANLADCCAFQGGFFIDIDGRPWSTEGTVDEVGMTVTWFAALRRLWAGSAQERVWAWEESRLTLKRRGDELELEDIHHSGAVAMPKVRVPFGPFSAAIVREGGVRAVGRGAPSRRCRPLPRPADASSFGESVAYTRPSQRNDAHLADR